MKHIAVVTPCYNEEGNVRELYDAIRNVFKSLPQYTYEHVYIDNASKDGTPALLRQLAAEDKRVKVIFNTRNFGHIRSPYHGMLQPMAHATIVLASDLQDPPALIPGFLSAWERGSKVVLGVKTDSEESGLMRAIRTGYYRLVTGLADIKLVQHATGFGLYDQEVIRTLRTIDDPYPYFRGLIADLGYQACLVPYRQAGRKRGITKNNFYTLYDLAMLGITNHSKVPLRLATMFGFAMSAISFIMAMGYLAAKLLFWYHFPIGMAPILIAILLFSSVQLFFIGVLGEYIGAIHTQVQKRPLVIERERLNFESPSIASNSADAQAIDRSDQFESRPAA